ncbi:hypothetical protein D3C87_1902010 [compost metagenome]
MRALHCTSIPAVQVGACLRAALGDVGPYGCSAATQFRFAEFIASWFLAATLEYIPVVRNSVGLAPKWRRKTLAK